MDFKQFTHVLPTGAPASISPNPQMMWSCQCLMGSNSMREGINSKQLQHEFLQSSMAGKKLKPLFASLHPTLSFNQSIGAEASSVEPKWKQKLAAADAHAAATRKLTEQAQEEYRKKQTAIRQQQVGGLTAVHKPLADLLLVPYLTNEGKFTDCSQSDAKATVYGIFDEQKSLQYIGISRGINPSLRLHFARMPHLCFYVKLLHITRPSRALLEGIREEWVRENGVSPPGNDGGEMQNMWENPMDCKPLMTDADHAAYMEAAPGPPKAKILKFVAKRIEAQLEAGFKARNCTETLRFDPKLKEQGLLDLKNVAVTSGPDMSVPTEKAII